MCDYSLCGLPTRLAADGEQLVVHKFSTGSMGMASPADFPVIEAKTARKGFWAAVKTFFDVVCEPPVIPAICIPPGAHLILRDIPEDLQKRCRVSSEAGVTFTQLTAEVNTYRDAIRFPNGIQLRLQDLREGMHVEVLSLATVEAEPVEVPVRRDSVMV
ncbi:MAG TPA: hypothetical protein VKS01_02670 [Bryobacteraceae bacterium]|nr:hypothetical protein [Bryobacteraceae bacterium]